MKGCKLWLDKTESEPCIFAALPLGNSHVSDANIVYELRQETVHYLGGNEWYLWMR